MELNLDGVSNDGDHWYPGQWQKLSLFLFEVAPTILRYPSALYCPYLCPHVKQDTYIMRDLTLRSKIVA